MTKSLIRKEITIIAGPNGSGKSEFFYNETKLWNKDEIQELTGIEDMVEKKLNNN